MDVKPSTSITVRGTFTFGKDTIEFEMLSFAGVGTEEFETQRLSQLVVNARKQFIDTLAHTLTPTPQPADSTIVSPQWAKVKQITKTTDRGKTYIKAHFGRFEKHGVTIWNEVLEKADILPSDIPDQPFTPENFAVLWGNDAMGKPRITQVLKGERAKEVLNERH